MAGKYELKKTTSGKFMFNLKAGNGQIILTSEQYQEKSSALGGIESVKKNSADDARYERKATAKGQPYFVLKAGNGQVIGTSETYSAAANMENGITSVKENGPTAVVDDKTD
ncbi:MAG: YegP family protein [Anaerolineae bacterium]|nr:YegP family protein [Anaerolineae bacterium]